MATAHSKLCTRCNLEKPFDAFSPDRRRPNGLFSACRECINRDARKGAPRPQGNAAFPEKTCTKCGVSKLLFHFPPRRSRASGYQSHCRTCRAEWKRTEAGKKSKAVSAYKHRAKNLDKTRSYWLKSKYGITLEQYEQMSAAQGGLCKLCGRPDRTRYKRLKIDHCHETGRIRGLLCGGCNVALGMLGDTPTSIRKALDYVNI